MATVPDVTSLLDYTTSDLEALERERPELGRVEIVEGALHATGESAVGIWHQLVVQRLYVLLLPQCPPALRVMIDTWWAYARGKVRADVAVYRAEDIPVEGEVFRRPPLVAIEVLSDDALHDLVAKDAVYREHGARCAYLDPRRRFGWWCRLDGVDADDATVVWRPDGWPPLELHRDALLARR
jgi:Uma2 family endonuclease